VVSITVSIWVLYSITAFYSNVDRCPLICCPPILYRQCPSAACWCNGSQSVQPTGCEFDHRLGRSCVRSRLWASCSHPCASTPTVFGSKWSGKIRYLCLYHIPAMSTRPYAAALISGVTSPVAAGARNLYARTLASGHLPPEHLTVGNHHRLHLALTRT